MIQALKNRLQGQIKSSVKSVNNILNMDGE